jgi:hypothetical protein
LGYDVWFECDEDVNNRIRTLQSVSVTVKMILNGKSKKDIPTIFYKTIV